MNACSTGKRRILTIDDNEGIHQDFETVLLGGKREESLDEMEAAIFGTPASPAEHDVCYELDHALQGEEGARLVRIAASQGCPYALVFVDMRMPPGWDGVETIRHIWKADSAVQVVVCTAFSDYNLSSLREHFRRTDSLLILKKPFAPEEVQQLASAMTEKWVLARRAALKMEELERLVRERTEELTRLNRQLAEEVGRRKASEDLLRNLALVDPLTGVPNRRLFDETLAMQWSLARLGHAPLALLMIDLDQFKRYNDHFGHQAGDECLRRVAKALKDAMNREQDFVARYGGEEFIAILPETDINGASMVAARIVAAVESLSILHAPTATHSSVTVSIGCASVVPAEVGNPRMLATAADDAMYRAKNAGRNRYECADNLPSTEEEDLDVT